MKNFIKEAYLRFNAETPVFFKKIVRAGVATGGLGVGLKGLVETGVQLPAIMVSHIPHMIAVGGVTALVAKMACVTPPSLTQPPAPDPDKAPKP